MSDIQVLVVDDSATVRQVTRDILDGAPGIEVMGAVADPIFARKHMEKAWPDVIVLDVEMPRMDGLTFLKQLMAERPTPVVMCSTLTEKGSRTSLRALELGAVEVVAKPKSNLKSSLSESGGMLVDAIRAAAKANLEILGRNRAPAARPASAPRPKLTADAVIAKGPPVDRAGARAPFVAIGTSTGGTQALQVVLSRLPADAPPVVVVQHMPAEFTGAFADRLDGLCRVKVKEARHCDRLIPGQVLIAPGGRHMLVAYHTLGMHVQIKDGPLVSRHRPSVDVLFRSVARRAGKHVLGIIMTGMGDDGATGMKEMHEAGARTVAQSERTCVIYGMPGVAVQRGGVDRVVDLEDIAGTIVQFGAGSGGPRRQGCFRDPATAGRGDDGGTGQSERTGM